MVANLSFLSGGIILETGRPSLKCFEGDWEGILPWGESIALINHGFHPPEKISSFVIAHFIDPSS